MSENKILKLNTKYKITQTKNINETVIFSETGVKQ